jgi:hypothetical protein
VGEPGTGAVQAQAHVGLTNSEQMACFIGVEILQFAQDQDLPIPL